jgi:dTDP-4-amino-4,6-dideoxygalactose transaminase
MTILRIPFIGLQKQYHNLRQEILDVTDQVLRSGQIMNGNWTAEFEHWLAKTNGVKYAITCHSGTQALEIIASFYFRLFNYRPRVLIPSLTYPATATAFARAGWDLHFVDVDSHGIMTHSRVPDSIEYDAMCLVGLYGAGLSKYLRGYDLDSVITIEDAAQHWISAGFERLGTVASISFDPTKNLGNFGNGGAVVTNYPDIAEWARNWRDNSKTSGWSLTAESTNSRMSEVDCAQMMVKTRHLASWQQRREQIARYWIERLEDTNVRCLIDQSNVDSHCFHKFVIDCDNRDWVQKQMTVRRVETRVHYEKPLHEMFMFQQFAGPGFLASASALSRRVLSLPIYPELTDLEVEYIIDQLRDCVSEEHN